VFPLPIYGRVERKYRIRGNSFFVRFTNSSSVPPAEDRIRMDSAILLVAIETKSRGNHERGLSWAAKKSLTI
jgi:hypothetical protein